MKLTVRLNNELIKLGPYEVEIRYGCPGATINENFVRFETIKSLGFKISVTLEDD